MVKRHPEIDFAAGAMVFPGGKVTADDRSSAWDKMFIGDATGKQRSFQIAAIRECFEETGVLLAVQADGQPVPIKTVESLTPLRGPVDRGEVAFSDVIKREQLKLYGGALIEFGNWLTPEFMPKRFDTFFYLAQMPEAQVATHDERETVDIQWYRPLEAIEAAERGEATIIFPTRMNLGRLGLASSCHEALERFSTDLAPLIEPVIGRSESDGPCLVIPDVEGYPQTREPIERVSGVARPNSKTS